MFDKYFKENTCEVNWEYIETIPEFQRLKTCEQNPVWHSEGTAWEHTVACVECACEAVKGKNYTDGLYIERLFILTVLFHDIGKGVTTTFSKNAWHAYGHEIEGARIARRILWDEGFEERENICDAIKHHMDVLNVFKHKDALNSIIKLTNVRDFRLLMLLKRCDILGSKPLDTKVTEDSLKIWDRVYEIGIEFNELFPYHKEACDYLKKLVFKQKVTLDEPQHITVMVGLPGAGKDTYIAKNLPNAINLSRDIIRYEMGFCKEGEKKLLSGEQEALVTKEFNKRLIEAVENKQEVVINNINLKRKYRDSYKELLKDYNIAWDYVYIEAPSLATNISRRDGQIDANVFVTLIDSFDFPDADEYNSLTVKINDNVIDTENTVFENN